MRKWQISDRNSVIIIKPVNDNNMTSLDTDSQTPVPWRILLHSDPLSSSEKSMLDPQNIVYSFLRSTIRLSKICIYHRFDSNASAPDMDDDEIHNLFLNLSDTNPLLSNVYNSYLEIKDSVDITSSTGFKHPFSHLIKGFALLKCFEVVLLEGLGIATSYMFLCQARAEFEVGITEGGTEILPSFNYLLLWGKGLCNLFHTFATSNNNTKQIFLKRAKAQLLEAYHLFTITKEEERLPFLNDSLYDLSPFYIGATFRLLGEYEIGNKFMALAMHEGNLPMEYKEVNNC